MGKDRRLKKLEAQLKEKPRPWSEEERKDHERQLKAILSDPDFQREEEELLNKVYLDIINGREVKFDKNGRLDVEYYL